MARSTLTTLNRSGDNRLSSRGDAEPDLERVVSSPADQPPPPCPPDDSLGQGRSGHSLKPTTLAVRPDRCRFRDGRRGSEIRRSGVAADVMRCVPGLSNDHQVHPALAEALDLVLGDVRRTTELDPVVTDEGFDDTPDTSSALLALGSGRTRGLCTERSLPRQAAVQGGRHRSRRGHRRHLGRLASLPRASQPLPDRNHPRRSCPLGVPSQPTDSIGGRQAGNASCGVKQGVEDCLVP